MPRLPRSAPRLIPLSAVTGAGDQWVAHDREPWLTLEGVDVATLRGRFVELTYRASLLDQPARPIIRFVDADGTRTDRIAAAPIAGAAIWTGRVPRTTRAIALSPTDQPGAFGFRIERLRVRRWPALLLAGARRRWRPTRSAVLTRLIGWGPESDNNLAWAIGATDFADAGPWLAARQRALGQLDRPRHDWSTAAPIVLVIRDGGAVEHTLVSLRAQVFPNWLALVLAPGDAERSADPRIVHSTHAGAIDHLHALAPDSLVGVLDAGDTLPAQALAFLAEQRAAHPATQLFYGDESVADRLELKPGWSPRLLAGMPYLGRAVFARVQNWSAGERRAFIDDLHLPPLSAPGAVRPLRRVLLERGEPVADRRAVPGVAPRLFGRAMIVLPTCDQPAMLQRVVASIRAKTPPGTFRLAIVDNGAVDGPSRSLLERMTACDDVTVTRRTEPFNFSAFCNDAVAASDEPTLVFLNDDMEVLSDDWLARLAGHAHQPDVGAVGARLTYPDGRLQHVGVLVGMGGSAGHFGALAPGEAPGWHHRNRVVHEVSAVTGACLCVTREKFVAVGGFDAACLPIELSDIDLCLKLNARGWQTILDPHVHLLHEESASRGGATLRRLDKYAAQRDIFVERWRHVLRDDPTFHPGLSLYSVSAALG